jgi:DeoR family transcriptional regulator, aga operon transcriptional repressor
MSIDGSPRTRLDRASRREQALELVRTRDFVRIQDLSDRFGVSIVTVRHDLDVLEDHGHIRRVRGGAVPRKSPHPESSYEAREAAQSAEKARIARKSLEMITSDSAVILDVGTTTMAIARELVVRTDLQNVTVFTSGINIALALERAIPRIDVVVTGGTLRPLNHSLVEPMAGLMYEHIRAATSFVGCNGIHVERGITTTNLPEAAMKQRMLAAGHRRIVVADATKFSQDSMVRVCGLEDLDTIVTAGDVDPSFLGTVREHVPVVVANGE